MFNHRESILVASWSPSLILWLKVLTWKVSNQGLRCVRRLTFDFEERMIRYWDIEVERIKKSGWLFGSPRSGVMSLVCDFSKAWRRSGRGTFERETNDTIYWIDSKQPGAVFLVQIWILRSILMEVWTCMEWNGAIGEEYVEDKRIAPFMIYVTLSIFHISSHWILSVCFLLAKHHCTFHTMCTSDARELILRHRKRWKPIRATRPTRLMMPAPQSLTVITVKIKGSDGNNHGDSEVCFFCPAFQYLDRFGGIQTPKGGAVLHPIQFTSWKLCEIRFAISEVQAADPTPNLEVQNCGVVLEVQDMFRQRKCLKLDAHFQGKNGAKFLLHETKRTSVNYLTKWWDRVEMGFQTDIDVWWHCFNPSST